MSPAMSPASSCEEVSAEAALEAEVDHPESERRNLLTVQPEYPGVGSGSIEASTRLILQ